MWAFVQLFPLNVHFFSLCYLYVGPMLSFSSVSVLCPAVFVFSSYSFVWSFDFWRACLHRLRGNRDVSGLRHGTGFTAKNQPSVHPSVLEQRSNHWHTQHALQTKISLRPSQSLSRAFVCLHQSGTSIWEYYQFKCSYSIKRLRRLENMARVTKQYLKQIALVLLLLVSWLNNCDWAHVFG